MFGRWQVASERSGIFDDSGRHPFDVRVLVADDLPYASVAVVCTQFSIVGGRKRSIFSHISFIANVRPLKN